MKDTLNRTDENLRIYLGYEGERWIGHLGQEFADNVSWKPVVLLDGRFPVRWNDNIDKLVPCDASDPDAFYTQAKVRWPNGNEGWISSDRLDPYIDDVVFLNEPALKFLSYDDMIAMPDPAWLVDGILSEATSALLFGKSNAFKSFLGIDIACSVATGTAWHGHRVSGPGAVLYVATEGSRGVGKLRVPGWMHAHEIPENLRRNIKMHRDEIALDDPNCVRSILDTIGHWKDVRAIEGGGRVAIGKQKDPKGGVALVVIDIFGASMGGPEVSDETARAWVRNVNRIMAEVGCTVLTIAHSGWADHTRARMHSHAWGSFDTRLKAEGDKESLTTVLTVDRHKDADSAGQWAFRLEIVPTPTGKTTLVPRLSDSVDVTQKRRVSGKTAIALQALDEALLEHGRRLDSPDYPSCNIVSIAQWRTMCKRHGLSDTDTDSAQKKAFDRNKKKLLEAGHIRQFDDHVWRTESK